MASSENKDPTLAGGSCSKLAPDLSAATESKIGCLFSGCLAKDA